MGFELRKVTIICYS